MTPVDVLARARALGVTLTPVGDRIRCHPGKAVTPELIERIRAVKPELLVLLAVHDRARRVRDTWSAAFVRLAPIARDSWPTGGVGVLQWIRPDLAGALARADERAETAARSYLDGGSLDEFTAALGAWEGLHRDAIAALGRLCHDCGRPAEVAVVLDDGRRICGACIEPRPQP